MGKNRSLIWGREEDGWLAGWLALRDSSGTVVVVRWKVDALSPRTCRFLVQADTIVWLVRSRPAIFCVFD